MIKVYKKKYRYIRFIMICLILSLLVIIGNVQLTRYFLISTVENFATARFEIDYKKLEECQKKRNSYYSDDFLQLIIQSGNTETINAELIENQHISHLTSKNVLYHNKKNGLYQVELYATIEVYSEADISLKNNMAISWLITLRSYGLWKYEIVAIEELTEDSHHHD